MDINEFRRELENDVQLRCQETGAALSTAFAEKITALLREAEYFNGDFQEAFFKGLHMRRRSNLQIDGYMIDDADDSINLFAVYYTVEGANLTKTQAETSFKMLYAFIDALLNTNLFEDIEPSLPIYELADHIIKTFAAPPKYRFILLTNGRRSLTLNEIKNFSIDGLEADCQIWDIERIFTIYSSMQVREEITLDFTEYGEGIPCLRADNAVSDTYESFLCVMPAEMLVDIYDRYGSRLLENNVRAFLSTKVKVNKNIRSTILNEPTMFFAFNNGIAVTVKELEFEDTPRGRFITSAVDFQIINGGQTTASLSSANFKDKARLDKIFIPMKLTKIGDMSSEQQEELIRKISRTSNSQNKVSEADFFSTHQFHVEMEKISRRISIEAGGIKQVKWFYERARGQYLQEQMRMTEGAKRKFQSLNPKDQVITKTDLAKFRLSWEGYPHEVSKGAQRCFKTFAELINKAWDKKPDQFNEHYFRETVSLAIMYKTVDRLVMKQEWYKAHRPQIVTYSIAILHHAFKQKFPRTEFNLTEIWTKQRLPAALLRLFEEITRQVNDFIVNGDRSGLNVSQWCKQSACWEKMTKELSIELPDALSDLIVDAQTLKAQRKAAVEDQKISLELDIQAKIVAIDGKQWKKIFLEAQKRNLIANMREKAALTLAMNIPKKLPSPWQCLTLIQLLDRLKADGYAVQ